MFVRITKFQRCSAFVTHHIQSRFKHVLQSEKANIHLIKRDECVNNRLLNEGTCVYVF